MILINTKDYLIGDDRMCADSERTFNIRVDDLATNKDLLDALNLISMYADKDNAKSFFKSYLGAFAGDEEAHEYLTDNPLLKVLLLNDVVDRKMSNSIQKK